MRFRPCIDVHNGQVKQIVGGSLQDMGNRAVENFVSDRNGDYYAQLYKKMGLTGGHVIMLNAADSPYYDATKKQALMALRAYPGGLQAGGGINDENAYEFLEAGASHVIVTSFVFRNGRVDESHLQKLVNVTGKNRLVLDLSCRKRDGNYYIVTDRWQKFTDVMLDERTIEHFASYCDELLVHAVDVEGKASGIETALVELLERACPIPVTYAGGVGSYADLEQLARSGKGHIDVTIGSALDLFGGNMEFDKVLRYIQGTMS